MEDVKSTHVELVNEPLRMPVDVTLSELALLLPLLIACRVLSCASSSVSSVISFISVGLPPKGAVLILNLASHRQSFVGNDSEEEARDSGRKLYMAGLRKGKEEGEVLASLSAARPK